MHYGRLHLFRSRPSVRGRPSEGYPGQPIRWNWPTKSQHHLDGVARLGRACPIRKYTSGIHPAQPTMGHSVRLYCVRTHDTLCSVIGRCKLGWRAPTRRAQAGLMGINARDAADPRTNDSFLVDCPALKLEKHCPMIASRPDVVQECSVNGARKVETVNQMGLYFSIY